MIKEKISHPSYATNLPRKEMLLQNFFIYDQLYTSRVSGYPIEIAWGNERNFSHGHHDGYEISYLISMILSYFKFIPLFLWMQHSFAISPKETD